MLKKAKDQDGSLHRRLRDLYNGTKPTAIRFRYALLAFDLAHRRCSSW